MPLPSPKDDAIQDVVERLYDRLGGDAFDIIDHWESDLCAIGLGSRADWRVLVYISTFGLPAGQYDVELELPPPPGSDEVYSLASRYGSIDFEGLVGIVRKHLRVSVF